MRLLLLLGLVAQVGWGCKCAQNAFNACGKIGDPGVVAFVGKVMRGSAGGVMSPKRAKVRVEEVLQGLPTEWKEVEVDVMAGTDCSFPLVTGRRYVLFAAMESGTKRVVGISRCSGSFELRGEEVELQALREALRGQGGTVARNSLVGKAVVFGGMSREPMREAVPVTLEGNGKKWETMSRESGDFAFRDLPVGEYSLRVRAAERYVDWHLEQKVRVRGERCVIQNLELLPTGEIAGRVLGVDGKPAFQLRVEAFEKEGRRLERIWNLPEATTDWKGGFVVLGLPPGVYWVGTRERRVRVELGLREKKGVAIRLGAEKER